jgi:hypothetical protein
MLKFDQGKHLGATCVVARWIPIQNFASWLDLLVEDKRQCGSVVAHLDDQELPQTMLEREALKLSRLISGITVIY